MIVFPMVLKKQDAFNWLIWGHVKTVIIEKQRIWKKKIINDFTTFGNLGLTYFWSKKKIIIFQINQFTKTKNIRLRFSNKKSNQRFWRTISWNFKNVSKLEGLFWIAGTHKIKWPVTSRWLWNWIYFYYKTLSIYTKIKEIAPVVVEGKGSKSQWINDNSTLKSSDYQNFEPRI